MALTDIVSGWAFVGLLAQAATLVLALLLFGLSPAGRTNRVFAYYLVLEAVASALGILLEQRFDGDARSYLFRVAGYYAFLRPFLLFYLISVYPKPRFWVGTSQVGFAALVGLATLVVGTYAFNHDLFLSFQLGEANQIVVTDLGPLILVAGLRWVVPAVATLVFALDFLATPPGPRRQSLYFVFLGFGLSTLYGYASVFLQIVSGSGIFPGSVWGNLYNLLVYLAALPYVWTGLILFLGVRRTRDEQLASHVRRAFIVLPLPVLSAVSLGVLGQSGPGFEFRAYETFVVGVWALSLPVLVTYALLRHRLFGFELRVKSLVRGGTVVGVFGAAFVMGAFITESLAPAGFGLLGGLAAAVLLGAIIVPLRRFGERLAEAALPAVRESGDYLAHRRLEIYLHALEEAQVQDPRNEENQRFAASLRKQLGITAREHRLLTFLLETRGRSPPAPAAERFRIERELGRGTYGRALLATDTVLERKVVLKRPVSPWLQDEASRTRFLREARIVARVNHANVVTIYEVLEQEGLPVLVLEYVDGGSLEDRLQKGPQPDGQAVQVALDVLAGLGQVHDKGIVHRDLKPGNVLLTSNGRAKVTDFGVAEPTPGAAFTAPIHVEGAILGSLAYMSPEQARGGRVDARTDLYAVAAVLYRALTGRHYIDISGVPEFEIRRRVEEAPPRLPAPEISAPVARVLAKALAKRPEDRYDSADEMARVLGASHEYAASIQAGRGRASVRRR